MLGQVDAMQCDAFNSLFCTITYLNNLVVTICHKITSLNLLDCSELRMWKMMLRMQLNELFSPFLCMLTETFSLLRYDVMQSARQPAFI